MIKAILFLLLIVPCTLSSQYRIVETHLLTTATPTKASHASTILQIGEGKFLSAWFGGEYEGHEEVGIYLAHYSNNKWKPGVLTATAEKIDGKTYPCWNPVLIKNEETIFLYYKVGPNPREWWGQLITSTDNGNSWSSPKRLPQDFLGPIRVKSLQLPNGDFLHPSSTETPDTDYWSMHFEVSDKNGKNWRRINVECDTFQVIQPTLLTLPDNRIMMMARSRHNKIIAAHSSDAGQNWSKLYALDLPNPNSGIDAIPIAGSNTYLMVYNPLTAGKEWWEGRSKLVLGQSPNGEHWKEILSLEDHDEGEFSYPAIIESNDGKVHITYTFDRKQIKHLVLGKL